MYSNINLRMTTANYYADHSGLLLVVIPYKGNDKQNTMNNLTYRLQ